MDDMLSREIGLPGFRFHPTEEELLDFYLKRMVFGHKLRSDVIGLLNIYLHDPWKLPGLAKINGEREWYFFVPRDRKHNSGGRPNRTTQNGFWKATGSDRRIVGSSDQKKFIGSRKTLVFYKGRAPRGTKTDWVMNEYRLPDNISLPQDIVLCRIYRKATSLKVLEQRAAMEEEMKSMRESSSLTPPPMDSVSNCSQEEGIFPSMKVLKKEVEEEVEIKVVEEEEGVGDEEGMGRKCFPSSCSLLQIPAEMEKLSDLQLPRLNMDWTQDLFWTQFNSPWLQNLTTYSDILNFQ